MPGSAFADRGELSARTQPEQRTTMGVTLGPYTIADLERLRDESDERYELIDGEVFVVPGPDSDHQTVSVLMTGALLDRVMRPGHGRVFHAPYDVKLSDVRVVQPDLVVVRPSDPATIERGRVVGPPSLVVEIVSPGSRVMDLQRKRALYADAGVPEYWLAEPSLRTVTVLWEPIDGDYRREMVFGIGETLRSATIPGLEIPIAEIFPAFIGKP